MESTASNLYFNQNLRMYQKTQRHIKRLTVWICNLYMNWLKNNYEQLIQNHLFFWTHALEVLSMLPPSSNSHQTSILLLPCFFWNWVLASRSLWSATFKGEEGLFESEKKVWWHFIFIIFFLITPKFKCIVTYLIITSPNYEVIKKQHLNYFPHTPLLIKWISIELYLWSLQTP